MSYLLDYVHLTSIHFLEGKYLDGFFRPIKRMLQNDLWHLIKLENQIETLQIIQTKSKLLEQ